MPDKPRYEIHDQYGRLRENNEREFRPIDGEDISPESFEKVEAAVAKENYKTAFKEIMHILTGKEMNL